MGPEQAEWYFSVVDVVGVLTESANPTDYLKKMRKRDEQLARIGKNCLPPAFCSGGWPITGRGR